MIDLFKTKHPLDLAVNQYLYDRDRAGEEGRAFPYSERGYQYDRFFCLYTSFRISFGMADQEKAKKLALNKILDEYGLKTQKELIETLDKLQVKCGQSFSRIGLLDARTP